MTIKFDFDVFIFIFFFIKDNISFSYIRHIHHSISLFSVVSKEDWESSLPEGSLEVEKKPEELPNTPVNKVVKRSTGVNRITILSLNINTQ